MSPCGQQGETWHSLDARDDKNPEVTSGCFCVLLCVELKKALVLLSESTFMKADDAGSTQATTTFHNRPDYLTLTVSVALPGQRSTGSLPKGGPESGGEMTRAAGKIEKYLIAERYFRPGPQRDAAEGK